MIVDETKLTEDLRGQFDRNVFVMMRYRSSTHFLKVECAIRDSLLKYGLIARLAKDCAISDDLWEKIKLYMQYSRLGIAVFEEIDERDFNPNISLELGFMYGLSRRCLLLKDSRMPRLPTDTCGKIYRDFDIHDLSNSIESQVSEWCERDLGLKLIATKSPLPDDAGKIIYDSRVEDKQFLTWGKYYLRGTFQKNIQLISEQNESDASAKIQAFKITAEGAEGVGVNKRIQTLFGKVKFSYKAIRSKAAILNLYFCLIPMQKDTENSQLVEVGANRRGDSVNGYSPYRQRFYIPHDQIGDERWHQGEIAFDFRSTPKAFYSIFAARINEGCSKPDSGSLIFNDVRIISYE